MTGCARLNRGLINAAYDKVFTPLVLLLAWLTLGAGGLKSTSELIRPEIYVVLPLLQPPAFAHHLRVVELELGLGVVSQPEPSDVGHRPRFLNRSIA